MHNNFVRLHQTSEVTNAMAAGVASIFWEMSDMARVFDDWEAAKKAAYEDNLSTNGN